MLQYLRSASLIVNDQKFVTRLAFSIEKQMYGASANGIKLQAYNLSQASRDHIEKATPGSPTKKMILSAGYQGNEQVIYGGDLSYIATERKDADIITSFEAGAGLYATSTARMGFSGQYSDWDVFSLAKNKLAASGIVSGFLSAEVKAALQAGGPKKWWYEGMASDLLNRLLKATYGFNWSIDNDALNVYAKGQFEDSTEVLINADTGMIGLPSKSKNQQFIVRALLNPSLIPGKKIRVQSKVLKLDAILKIFKVTHVGDTLEGDWYSEVETGDKDMNPNGADASDE